MGGCCGLRVSESQLNGTQTELLRLSRTNFSEAYQALVHLKVVRLFVESVLRYGPPATFTGVMIQVCSRSLPSRDLS
jgi:hypothetical protein